MNRKLAVVLIVLAFAGLAAYVYSGEDIVGRGRRVSETVTPSCKTCHNPSQLAPFSGAREDIRLWITDPEEAAEKAGKAPPKKPAYNNLEARDLDALVAFVWWRIEVDRAERMKK